MANWGIYDMQDSCWLGDESGPRVFDDHITARIAAQVTECQLYGSDLGGRIVAKELDSSNLRLKDEVTAKLTPLEALQRIEGTKQ